METAKEMNKPPAVRTKIAHFGLIAGRLGIPTLAAFCVLLWTSPVPAQSGAGHLPLASTVAAPNAARDLCVRYAWACRGSKEGVANGTEAIALAQKVNRRINRRVQSVDDIAQYRVKDYWALPSGRGGDCEDFALLKKRELIKLGIPAGRLLIATVFSRKVGPHAVLVLRLDDGDHVLDNLDSRIKAWHQTDYTFLRVQNPARLTTWVGVASNG